MGQQASTPAISKNDNHTQQTAVAAIISEPEAHAKVLKRLVNSSSYVAPGQLQAYAKKVVKTYCEMCFGKAHFPGALDSFIEMNRILEPHKKTELRPLVQFLGKHHDAYVAA